MDLISKEQLESMTCKICLKDVSNPTDRMPARILGENGFDPDLCNDCWKKLETLNQHVLGELVLPLLRLGASVAARDYQDRIRKLEGDLMEALGEEEV